MIADDSRRMTDKASPWSLFKLHSKTSSGWLKSKEMMSNSSHAKCLSSCHAKYQMPPTGNSLNHLESPPSLWLCPASGPSKWGPRGKSFRWKSQSCLWTPELTSSPHATTFDPVWKCAKVWKLRKPCLPDSGVWWPDSGPPPHATTCELDRYPSLLLGLPILA